MCLLRCNKFTSKRSPVNFGTPGQQDQSESMGEQSPLTLLHRKHCGMSAQMAVGEGAQCRLGLGECQDQNSSLPGLHFFLQTTLLLPRFQLQKPMDLCLLLTVHHVVEILISRDYLVHDNFKNPWNLILMLREVPSVLSFWCPKHSLTSISIQQSTCLSSTVLSTWFTVWQTQGHQLLPCIFCS